MGPPAARIAPAAATKIDRVLIGGGGGEAEARIRIGAGALAGTGDPVDDDGRLAGGHGSALDTDAQVRGRRSSWRWRRSGFGCATKESRSPRRRAAAGQTATLRATAGATPGVTADRRTSGTARATDGGPVVERRRRSTSVRARRCRRRRRRRRERSRSSWPRFPDPGRPSSLRSDPPRWPWPGSIARRPPRRRSSWRFAGETPGGACRWRSRSRRGWSTPRSAAAVSSRRRARSGRPSVACWWR